MPRRDWTKTKKNRSFLIEILQAGALAGRSLTICGREVMTLSGRCLDQGQEQETGAGKAGPFGVLLPLIRVPSAGGKLAVFFAAARVRIGGTAARGRVRAAALVAHLCS